MVAWEKIKGFEDYEINKMGVVRSCKFKTKRVLADRPCSDGYLRVSLRKDGKAYERKIHRLVALQYIPNPDNLETVNHINGIKTDNRVENLEWSNRADQLQHAYDLGLKVAHRGSDVYCAKLTDDEVRYIRRVCKKGCREFGTSALSKKFNVDNTTIGNVVNYKTYKDVK